MKLLALFFFNLLQNREDFCKHVLEQFAFLLTGFFHLLLLPKPSPKATIYQIHHLKKKILSSLKKSGAQNSPSQVQVYGGKTCNCSCLCRMGILSLHLPLSGEGTCMINTYLVRRTQRNRRNQQYSVTNVNLIETRTIPVRNTWSTISLCTTFFTKDHTTFVIPLALMTHSAPSPCLFLLNNRPLFALPIHFSNR